MRKTVIIIALVTLILPDRALAVSAPPHSKAASAILYEANSDTVLFEEKADERRPIASITKIMTALVVLENCGMEDEVIMKREWALTEGSSSQFEIGEKYTVRQLLYALMLASGNDAAVALACRTAGSVAAFAKMMNDKAKLIGMTNSSFVNPHGLDDKEHYSTARDMAKLSAEAMKNKDFALLVSTREAKVGGRVFRNHNKLLWNYPGIAGVKTGFTSKAGRTLVSCAVKNKMMLICVTLNDGDDWNDHMELYDWAASAMRYEKALSADVPLCKLPLISGVKDAVSICASRNLTYLLSENDNLEVVYNLPRFVYAGVEAGEKAGEAQVFINGELKETADLLFAEAGELDKNVPLTAWEKFKWAWYLANEQPNYYRFYY